MKKTVYVVIVLLFIIEGCQKTPTADFNIVADRFWTYETILFHNKSFEAYSYNWDFGDSTTSTFFNTSHFYTESGNYLVKLTAFAENGKKKDVAVKEINIIQPIDLLIQVIKTTSNEAVKDCWVYLYNSLEEWKTYTNKLDSLITNEMGYVLFRDMKSKVYYIDAYKRDEDGFWANWETGFVTDTLLAETVNSYIIELKHYSTDTTRNKQI